MNLYKFFSTFVGHFCPPGSTGPIESGFIPDPDPHPWFKGLDPDPHRPKLTLLPRILIRIRKGNIDPDAGAITWTVIKNKLYFSARPIQVCVGITRITFKNGKILQQSVDPDSGPHGSALVWFPVY